MKDALEFRQALDEVLRRVNILDAEAVPILSGLGQVLAEDICTDGSLGSPAVYKGAVVTPSVVELLSSLGRDTINVIRRPRVAVIPTGEELIEPGEKPQESHVYNSNAYMLAAGVRGCGGIPYMPGIARDNEAATAELIRQSLDKDLVITAGGSSKGDRDYVRPVLARLGEIVFTGVRMTPGGPFTLGILEGTNSRSVPLLAMPGVPSGCFVTFEVFARPAILKMAGKPGLPVMVEAAMSEAFRLKKDGLHLRWVNVE